MPKLNELIKAILKFFSNIGTGLIVAILVGFFGITTLIAYVTHTLNYAIQAIKTPTPLWVATILVLLVVLYIKIANSQAKPPKNKIGFVETGKYKWKVTVKPNGSYEVHNIPFCFKHDRLFVEDIDNKYICSHMENNKLCNDSIEEDAREAFYKAAVSLAEKEIRTKNIKLR